MNSPLTVSSPILPTNRPRAADQNLTLLKSLLSLFLFAPVVLLAIGLPAGLNLAPLVLVILSLGAAFTIVRACNLVRMAQRIRATFEAEVAPGALALRLQHVIVVPIYKESVETIGRTLRRLASHESAATNYIVLCAFEKHDPAHEDKMRRIRETYDHDFLTLVTSIHTLAPHECPGKASNVDHAVRTFAASQTPESFAETIVTVIDCDTLIDRRYFAELERCAAGTVEPHAAVFAAPAFFAGNRAEVPCFVRAMDDLWSLSAAANIFSVSGMGFPISTYSLSLRMLNEMDYWDVDADAVGEDFHTFVKAAVKFGDRARLVPLAVPMNNEHVSGYDYRGSLLARYSQSLRHALGISSTAYLMRHMASSCSPRRLLLLVLCLESHLLPLLYFASGLYILGCLVTGRFAEDFGVYRLTWLLGLWCVSTVAFCIAFGVYKRMQYFLRRHGFGQPTDWAVSLATDGLDLTVQGTCALAYFVVPFGYRAYQNLVFRRHRTYYNRIEERTRKYCEAGPREFSRRA